MKRLYNQIKLFLPAFSIVLILVLIHIYRDCLLGFSGDVYYKELDVLNIIITIFLSIILVTVTIDTGKRAEKTQRNTMKLELFDKRYKIFESLVDVFIFLDENLNGNFNHEIITYQDLNIPNKRILQTRMNLYKAMVKSEAIYDMNIYNKLSTIYTEYSELTKLYFNIIKSSEVTKNRDSANNYINLIETFLFNSSKSVKEACDKQFKVEFPELYCEINKFNIDAENLKNKISSCGIYSDFDTYLKIHNIDN